jgi:small subunit ribosomal protein S2
MAEVGIKELLEAGVHFGHQTRRWNPAMRRYIYGERDGIHIIDLLQTEQLLTQARDFAGDLSRKGGTVLFVGTKKQARDSIQEWAERTQMPFVNRRWLGGLLTNYNTISARIKRLHELTELQDQGRLELLPTKERMGMQAELAKLEYNLGGVRDMERLPDAVFAIDYVIPGNDDAIRSCELAIGTVSAAIDEGASAWRTEEERRRAEEEAQRRREEEERRKREEEEKARKEAEEAAAAQAAAAAAEGQEGAEQAQPQQPAQQAQPQPAQQAQPAQQKPPAQQAQPPSQPQPQQKPPAEQPEPAPAQAADEGGSK